MKEMAKDRQKRNVSLRCNQVLNKVKGVLDNGKNLV